MADINKALVKVFGVEGGYIHDADDPGGETKFGICKRSYPNVNIKALTIEQASEIYRKDYRPRSGSPLIGAGTPISGLTTDYAGKLWKNPPSIGAYEYYRKGGNRGFSGFNLGFGL